MIVKQRLFMAFLCLLFSTTIQAQSINKIKLSGNYEEKSLISIFVDWSARYRLNIEYDVKSVKGIKVTTSFRRLSLDNALKVVLQKTEFTHSINPPLSVRIFPRSEQPIQEVKVAKPTRSNFTLKGTIKDEATGETLPYANVYIKGTTKGTTTNVDGYFTLFEVPSDTAVIVVKYLGYQSKYFRLNPASNINNLRVNMTAMGSDLQEVLVVATEEEQMIKASTGISKVGLTPAQIATLPSFGEKDIFRSLQLLPGISGTNESSSGLYVRGGTPDQNLVLFDGFTVYHVDHLFGFFSAFNSNAVKDVQIHKGGFESKFGGRTSSVVELTGKDGNTEEFNVGAGISLVAANVYAESPFADGKGSFLVAGRRSFQSDFYNNLFTTFTENSTDNNPAGRDNQGGGRGGGRFGFLQAQPNSFFYDLNAKVTYRPSKKDVISLSFYNGEDDLDNSRILDLSALPAQFQERLAGFNNDIIDQTQWGNWGGSLKWSRRWSEQFYTNANVSFSNYYSNRERSNKINIITPTDTIDRSRGVKEDNDLKDYTFKLDNEYKISATNQLEFGVQATYNDITYDFIRDDTIDVLNREDKGWTSSLYLQDRWTIAEKLVLKGGLRANHFSVSDKVYIEPRASLIYQANEQIKLKGAYGQYNQFATRIVRNDIQQGSRDFWVLANDDNIPVSYAEHFIGGVSYETPDFLFDVEAYHKNLTGLSEYTAQNRLIGFGPNATIEYQEDFFEGTGFAQGIDFLIQKKKGLFTGWLAYTLGRVRYDFPDLSDNIFPALHDQTHEFKLVGSYKWQDWVFSGIFVYATGKPYTAPTGVYELTLLDGTTQSYFQISDKNALRLPDYHRIDLSATKNFSLGASKGTVGLSIYNLYNRQNVWYKEFEVVDGDLLETDVTLLNFTPSLFLTWNLR